MTLDALSSNHLPVKLTLYLDSSIKKSSKKQYTNWHSYKKICNSYPIYSALDTPQKIDEQIGRVQDYILRAYRKSTHPQTPSTTLPTADHILQDLMKPAEASEIWQPLPQIDAKYSHHPNTKTDQLPPERRVAGEINQDQNNGQYPLANIQDSPGT